MVSGQRLESPEVLDLSIVEVCGNGNAGTGFFVHDRTRILTCSHVVLHRARQSRGEPIPRYVSVRRPGFPGWVVCLVDLESWSGVDGEDVALLRCFAFSAADSIKPLKVYPSTPEQVAIPGSKFHSTGFPNLGGIGPILFTGQIERRTFNYQGHSVSPLFQVKKSTGLTSGCSGAPAVADDDNRILGMVRLLARPDANGALTEMAFLTPVETLLNLHPTLAEPSEVSPDPIETVLMGRSPAEVASLGDDEYFLSLATPAHWYASPYAYVSTTNGDVIRLNPPGSDIPFLRVARMPLGPRIGVVDTLPQQLVGLSTSTAGGMVSRASLGDSPKTELLTPDGWEDETNVSTGTAERRVELASLSRPAVFDDRIFYVSTVDRGLWEISLSSPRDQKRLCLPPTSVGDRDSSAACDVTLANSARGSRFFIADSSLGIVWTCLLASSDEATEIVAGGGSRPVEDGMSASLAKLSPTGVAYDQNSGQLYISERSPGRVYRYKDGRLWRLAELVSANLKRSSANIPPQGLGEVQSIAYLEGFGLLVVDYYPANAVKLVRLIG